MQALIFFLYFSKQKKKQDGYLLPCCASFLSANVWMYLQVNCLKDTDWARSVRTEEGCFYEVEEHWEALGTKCINDS